ncbi:response regulator transcription factor [Paenibacillus alba]|uniref:Response regulator n=1 Tax=Paenibacillus alba TaxID=1197127 RepID=A0ABU6GAJ1_9BACL|nr:response regulator [Paenibacillus alba]MEC0230277.1 response regulator [Paenibacillus alba]
MYRLLIVDDEPAIVEGLVQMFQEREELDLDICKAYSAFEAIDVIKKTKIDVVLSDIRMPEKNGLQLMDEILFYWPACKIIFLTGHNEFDYVYTAIQKNVESYILKTEEDKVVIGAVTNALKKLEDELRNKDIVEKARNQMLVMAPLLKKELFEALLLGERVYDLLSEELFAEQAVKLNREAPVLLLVGKIDSWSEGMSYGNKRNALYAVRNLVEQYWPSVLTSEEIVYENSMMISFLQLAANADRFRSEDDAVDWRGLVTYLKGILESVQNACRDLLQMDVSFVISRGAVEWDNLHKEFELMKAMIKKRMVSGQKMTMMDLGMANELFKVEPSKVAAYSDEFNKKLRLLEKKLDEGDEPQAETICKDLIISLQHETSQNYLLGLERYYAFVLVFLANINNQQLSDRAKDHMPIESFAMMDIPGDWMAVESYYLELGKQICLEKQQQVEKGENLLVERIHRFINENLSGDLSLARIAEVVHFNPSYLSRFYKQLTGRNLSDYINATKAEMAVNMLEDMQMKINEIALKLGFESPSYFTAFFRKMKEVSPQEFREAILHKTRK